MGRVPYSGHAFRIRGYDNGPRGPAPLLGGESFEILAESLGFEDVQHFARYFRSAREMSPLAYRKSFGKQTRKARAQNGESFSQTGVVDSPHLNLLSMQA